MTSRTQHKNPRWRNAAARKRVMAAVIASEDTCFLCGRPVDKTQPAHSPGAPEVDEDIPVSRGGSPWMRSNCHLAHHSCNELKKNHSTAWARARLGYPGATGAATDATDAIRANRSFD